MIQYTVQKDDYIELFIQSPSVKKLKLSVVAGNIFIGLMAYLVVFLLSEVVFEDEGRIFDINITIFIVFSILISCLYTLRKFKIKSKEQGERNFKNFYDGQMFSVEYDMVAHEFKMGNRKEIIPVDNQMKIVSARTSYNFYRRKDKNCKIFLLPRNGDEEYQRKIDAILKSVLSSNQVTVKESTVKKKIVDKE